MDRPLEGRTALVAGGGRNLGRAAAIEFARRGADVVIVTRQAGEESAEAAKLIEEASGSSAVVLHADVSRPVEARGVVADAINRTGGIDILLSTIGRGRMRPFLELEPDEWEVTLHANVTSLCFLAQAALPGMVERRWGRIIGVGGHTNLRGDAERTSTAAAKAAIVGLVRSLSSEFYEYGITANVISPGAFDTQRDGGATGPASAEERARRYGVVRLGRPEEFAATSAFLASPEASYLTGQNILVNGGMLYQ